jgi:hypothetical protein
MFYFVAIALAASVQSIEYGPGSPLVGDPRLVGIKANPFADAMRLPIQMKQCRAASHYNADAIFDQSFICPKNKLPATWPVNDTDRFFIPDNQFPYFAQ